MQFVDGTTTTAVYNRYGYRSTTEPCGDVPEWGFLEPIDQRAPVRRPKAGSLVADELETKRKRGEPTSPEVERIERPDWAFSSEIERKAASDY
jgi:hypothetical protein